MTEDKKITPPEDEHTPEMDDPAVTALLVADLQNQIMKLKEENITLQYEVGGMGDMARMNAAKGLFAAMIDPNEYCHMDGDEKREEAVDQADKLIGHYQDIIEKNAVEYQKRLAGMEAPEDEPVN